MNRNGCFFARIVISSWRIQWRHLFSDSEIQDGRQTGSDGRLSCIMNRNDCFFAHIVIRSLHIQWHHLFSDSEIQDGRQTYNAFAFWT